MILRPTLLLSLLILTITAAATTTTLTVHAWPLSAPTPQPYATIHLSPDTLTIHSLTPPTGFQPNERIRIGLLSPADNTWTGVATSANAFRDDVYQKITLHADEKGEVGHLSFGSFLKPSTTTVAAGRSAQKERVMVEVVAAVRGPEPVLNRPVVLNAEGKVDKPGEKDERSFLQKYWWAIGLFLVVQVVAGGGKE